MTPSTFTVAFDLDGTLFSSAPILWQGYRDAISAWNRRQEATVRIPRLEEILALVGRPVYEIFSALFPELPPATRETLATDVLACLTAMIRRGEGELYAGVPEMLARLAAEGCRLALVSNCRRAYLEAIVETYALAPRFSFARCNEDAPELGKPGLLKQALAGGPGLMVGDRASDGEAASAAGVPWIGCDYGHADPAVRNELRAATRVVASVAEIPAAVAALRERRQQ